jgi:tetratricopeptide (TPR) repeat protein
MPRREDIEQFKRVLASYGAGPKTEAGTVVAGSEDAEPRATEPEAGTESTDRADLDILGDIGTLDDAAAAADDDAAGTPAADDDGAPPDIGDLLSSLDGELGGGSAAAAAQGDENLDLSALFGEEEGPATPEPPAPARGGRQKKPRPPRAPKEPRQPKPRRERHAEPGSVPGPSTEPSLEEAEALADLSAWETPALPGDVEPAPSEAPVVPTDEPASGEPEIPLLDMPDTDEIPAEPAVGHADTEEPAEALPEFLGPLPTAPDFAEETGAGAEEALLAPFESAPEDETPVDDVPSLTGDLDEFGVLPEEPATTGPGRAPVEAPEPPASIEPDLSGLEEGVTHSDLPDIGGLDELTLPDEPVSTPTKGPAARPSAGAATLRRGAPPRAARPSRTAPGRIPARPSDGAVPTGEAAPSPLVGDIELTDEQFDRLRRTLGVLPRNLKIAVQDIVAGAASPTADLAALIGLLVTGAEAKEIAALAGKITGKRIRIPSSYERRTGLALEREQRTFAYAFRQNILPLVRLFALAVVGAGLVGFLGYRFVWQPLSAAANYRRGYEQLQAERYPLANERFARAVNAWPMRRWYFRYAEGFRAKGRYELAAGKYEELLARWPNDRKAVLDWAAMESTERARFEQADEILHRILDRAPTDYDALLAAGDNFLEWAAMEGDPKYFEAARVSWAELMQAHGQRDEVLFRMLRYFVRTDDLAEAERLRAMFFDRRRFSVDTEAARSLAELGGYLVDKRQLDWVRDVLLKASDGDPALPDVPYQLARLYRILEDPQKELSALEYALVLMDGRPGAIGLRDVQMRIDAQTRLGEMFYGQQRYLDAARELRTAVALVKRELESGLITAEVRARLPRLGRLLGRPFAKLADISYYVEGDLATAGNGYRDAAGYGYTGPEIDYKLGYIAYAGAQWLTALGSFSDAEEGLAAAAFAAPGDEAVGARAASSKGRVPINLVYAQGNAFYRRGDLFAAQGSWLRVLDAVETRLAAIDELAPLTRPDHRALLEYRMRANNNLGVATAMLAGRTGERRRTSQALAYLAAAAETADMIARAPETLVASEAKSLPALNMRGVLYPLADFELQIYQAIPKDLETGSF